MMGHQMLATVAAWDLYRMTHSPIALGNVGLAQVLPVFLFTFITGQVADRYNRRKTLAITQTSAAMVGIALALAGSSRGVGLIYACLFLVSSTRAFQWPTTASMLPQTIPMEQLTSAVSWNGSAREMATMLGPSLAGLMIQAWGTEPVYIAQAICAATSAILLTQVKVPPIAHEKRAAPGWQGFKDGMHFVWRERIIFWTMSLDLLAVLFGGATALMPIFAQEILKVGPRGFGWLESAPAVGAALMSLVLAHFGTIRSAGRVLLGAVIGFGAATIMFGLSSHFPLSLAALFLVGVFDAVSVVLRISLVQLRTPDYLRGRVSAVNALFISSSNQWGAVESGVAAKFLGVVPAVVFGGVMTVLVVGAIGWHVRELRDWEN
jgi:MFS family permease